MCTFELFPNTSCTVTLLEHEFLLSNSVLFMFIYQAHSVVYKSIRAQHMLFRLNTSFDQQYMLLLK